MQYIGRSRGGGTGGVRESPIILAGNGAKLVPCTRPCILIFTLCIPIVLDLPPPLGSEVCAKCRSLVSYVLHRVRFRDVGRSENLGGRGRGRVIIDLPISEGTCKV